ncbi:hypothetical protein EIP86_006509 [Pleurotus ostreatoroseus]|nr:hypothetical protein EIP86_006509 [Pleurotus ostreatoroseus]
MSSYLQDARGSPPASLSSVSSPESYYNPLEVDFSSPRTLIPRRSKQAMAAIHTLPIEILSRIFLLGLPDGEYPEFPPSAAPPFEVLVSHVCQHWRAVALRIPHLWAIVHLRTVPHIDRARQYLVRSGRVPLHILVDTCDMDEHVPGFLLFRDEFLPVFALLTPHIDRWRSMQCKVRDRQCKLGARQVLSTCGPAVNLEFLQLWHVETWETSERLFTQIGPPPVVVFNKSLPSLRHISLIGVNLPWTHAPFLEDLISIDFGLHAHDVRMPYHLWERMLATSPNLDKLALHYSGPKGTAADWPNTAVRLPSMRELVLEEMVPATLLQLMPRLCMPHLKVLRLNLPSLEDGEDCTAFLEYLVDPPPPLPLVGAEDTKGKGKARADAKDARGPVFRELDTLALDALECSAESFARFLVASPTIRHLSIDGRKLGKGLFEELMRVYDASGPGPVAVPVPDKRADAGSSASVSMSTGSSTPDDRESSADEDVLEDRRLASVRESGSSKASTSSGREGSSDSSDSTSGSASLSASTALTTPSLHSSESRSPMPPSASLAEIVLPQLQTVRVSGVDPAALVAYVRFRRAHGRPVRRWRVGVLMRCPELEELAAEIDEERRRTGLEDWDEEGERLIWEDEEEEEEEEESGSEEYDGEDGDEGEEGEGSSGDAHGEDECEEGYSISKLPTERGRELRHLLAAAHPAHAPLTSPSTSPSMPSAPAPSGHAAEVPVYEDDEACEYDDDEDDDDADGEYEDEPEDEAEL